MSENESEYEQVDAADQAESSPAPDEAPGIVERGMAALGLGGDSETPLSEEESAATPDPDGGPADAPATDAARKKAIRKNMGANNTEAAARKNREKFRHLEPDAVEESEPADDAAAE